MDRICNDVAQNLMLFGHLAQATPPNEVKNFKDQQLKNNTPQRYTADSNSTNIEDIFNTFDNVIKTLKEQEEAKKFDQKSFNPTSPFTKNKENMVTSMANQSKNKEKAERENRKREVLNSEEPFNILGLFKPGEFLNKVSKGSTGKAQSKLDNPKLGLKYLT